MEKKTAESVLIAEHPELRNPAMIAAFAGWSDAASCATSAVRLLIEQWSAGKFATIDPEEFYDFSMHRPTVTVDDHFNRTIEWPANEFYFYQAPDQPRDFVLFVGVEPNTRWRTYTSAISSVAQELGVTDVVTVGALIAEVVHSTPVQLTGSSNSPELRDRMRLLNIGSSRYQGPTGITSALSDRCTQDGMHAMSIWGSVPHYIPTTPNPKVVTSMLRHLRDLLRFDLDLRSLEVASRRFEEQVTDAVNANTQLRDYVRERESKEHLENEPEEGTTPADDFPSGETLVRSLEEFLRQNRPRPTDT
ncbi:MAG: PAC2 family protein [Chloroflexota bacterium]